MEFSKTTHYVLGIDLGVVSLGWAALEVQDGQPIRLLDAGVRAWELEGISETDVSQGQETPPAQERRRYRTARRQLFRRAQRLRRTYRVLQQLGFFPPGSWNSQQRKAFLQSLDQQAIDWLRQNVWPNGQNPQGAHTWIYQLRAAALDRPLPGPLLGRVFFHLAQRRGFQTTARIQSKDDQERSQVKQSISQLQQAIQAAGARTLGEYLAQVDPHQQRIRGRWTSRPMYLQEFEAIWAAQAPFYPQLDGQAKKKLRKALFFQRPLKSQRSLVGRCSLETLTRPGPDGKPQTFYPHRRARMASLEAQRIRYVQRINDLQFIDPQGQIHTLSPEHRSRLYQLAETQEELSFAAIRKALGIPTGKKGQDWKCNLEAGGEKKLPGNSTAARLRRILGDDGWEQLGPDKQKELVDTLIGFLDQKALERHLQTRWGFSEPIASQLAQLELEAGYHRFSRRAIRKLLPLLYQGLRLNEAIHRLYGDPKGQESVYDLLPPVRSVYPTLNNPLLIRALTELRKVVNALVRRYGKPILVRIEVARDLKRPRREREKLSLQMRQQEARRKAAAETIRQHFGREAKPFEILKFLLAEECHWECPYTGRKITLENLLGEAPQFDVEHIWPFPRSLDDSFLNKTLCYHEENRLRKSNRTPYEAYGSDPQRWAEIITRVAKFKKDFDPRKEKLRRFQTQEIPADFPNRHLSDTRWISRQAADYLGLLYGGRTDASGRQRVFTTMGTLTALLRRAWDLDRILGPTEGKNRFDHRHHAIDAVVVALTDPGVVQAVSRAAARLAGVRARPNPQLEPPWPQFFEQVRDRVLSILVSFRPHHRVSGPLHQQTYYALRREVGPEPQKIRTKVRKPLANLSPTAVQEIVDPAVRRLVQEKLQQLGLPPNKAFTNPENLPRIVGKGGQQIPVKSVRVWETISVFAIGQGPRLRCVTSGANHHLELFALLDEQGNERGWSGQIVSLWEAVQRKRRGQPVVCRDHGPGTRFKFTLAKGDYIEWTDDQGNRQILRVVGISENDLEFRLPFDARPSKLILQEKQRIRARYNTLFQRKARKVTVSPLGEVFPAND